MDTTVVQAVRGDAWERIRALRLEALKTDPDAFGSTYEAELGRPESWWRERADDPDCLTLIGAVEGRAGGLCVARPWRDEPEVLGLFAMWVAPWARRRGLGAALVRSVRAHGLTAASRSVRLEVEAGNRAAEALYRGLGFRPTGRSYRQPAPREHLVEREFVLELARARSDQ